MGESSNQLGKYKTDWKIGDGIPLSWAQITSNFISNFKVTGKAVFNFDGATARLHIRGGGGAAAPFDLSFKGVDGSTGEMLINPGTATAPAASGPDDVVPMIGTDLLNADPAPVLEFDTDASEDGTHEVYLGVKLNGTGKVILDEWKITHKKPADTAPANVAYDVGPAEVFAEAYLLLGSFEVEGEVVTNIKNFKRTSLSLAVCDVEGLDVRWWGFGGITDE